MKLLKNFLHNQEKNFTKGGKFEKFYALFEAIDTFVFTPADVTRTDAHVRDGIDLKRVMITVAWALTPIILFAMYNTGLQAALGLVAAAAAKTGDLSSYLTSAELGWRVELLRTLGLAIDPENIISNFIHGALYFVPVFLVANMAGGIVEAIFAGIRKHEINEGFLVTGLLYPLILPPTIPLWQVAIGVIFGVVVAKEVFGGTGKNILNVALTSRVFLFFAYPAQISGDAVWVAVDGYTMATPLAQAAAGGMASIETSWWDAFLGFIPGSMGETSTLLCLVGALYLIKTGIGSWRIMLSMTLGMIGMSLLLNSIGSDSNLFFNVTPQWHFVIGSFAFACAFMATDPVTATMTDTGRWIYGFLIGTLGVLIRVLNPAYPEGWMLAILFMNVFAPLIDYFVIKANITRRMVRNG